MITGQLANILKLFLPSWNFFNDFSAVPRLDARIIRDGIEADWHRLYAEHSTRGLSRAFFNAHGNLELLEKTFIDRAAEEFEQSAHHNTLAGIVRSRIAATQPGDAFQFRLVMTTPGAAEEVLFTSTRHPVQEEPR